MTADEMFKELGYEIRRNSIDEDDFVEYKKTLFNNEEQYIVFDIENELININREDFKNFQSVTSILSRKELKAINKKVEELGW